MSVESLRGCVDRLVYSDGYMSNKDYGEIFDTKCIGINIDSGEAAVLRELYDKMHAANPSSWRHWKVAWDPRAYNRMVEVAKTKFTSEKKVKYNASKRAKFVGPMVGLGGLVIAIAKGRTFGDQLIGGAVSVVIGVIIAEIYGSIAD